MENKKINVTFYLVTIVFLVLVIILIKDFKAQRANDFRAIKILSNRLAAEEKENADLKNTLADTRNALDALSKKLAGPTHAS